MSKRARVYIAIIFILGAILSWTALPGFKASLPDWPTFLALTTLATLAQLFKAEAPGHKLYYATRVFQFAGLLLLHPFQFVLLQVICHVVEWGKERLMRSPQLRNWYIQPFNINVHIIAGLTARWVYMSLEQDRLSFLSASSVLAAMLSAFTYLLVNHLLIAFVLFLARGVSKRELFDMEQGVPDYVNLCLGYAVAVLWQINPWLIVPVLSPLIVIYQALKIPQLKQEAQIDTKTELWNARHFNQLFAAEMDRARRFGRPIALLMADLDLLRNINNSYGHLAGDAVLKGIGRIIRESIREYDIAGRFGGEEFAIALPETELHEAQAIAERIRQTIMNTTFQAPTSDEAIHATISIGLACFPADAASQTDLVHAADIAVYQAKLNGRNRVVCASDLPHSVKLEAGTTARHTSERIPHAAASAYERAIPAGAEGARSQPGAPATAPVATAAAADAQSAPHKLVVDLFVYGIILLGMLVAVLGSYSSVQLQLPIIALFAALALAAELLQIDLYEAGSLSVSVAIAFATAIVAGIPGVVCVSLAITLAHYFQRQPPLYKAIFNWATHVLAGAAPILTLYVLQIQVSISNLPLLVLPLAIAGLAYFIIETGLVATAIGFSESSRPLTIWRQRYRWLAVHYLSLCIGGIFLAIAQVSLDIMGIVVFLLPVLMMRFAQKQYVERTEDSMRELRRLNQELTSANREILLANHSIHELNDDLFRILAKILDARAPYVSGHAARMAEYAVLLAKQLKLPPPQVEQIRQSAFLHDVGKIGIAEHILHKPGRLTTEEYEHIKTHAALGATLLETCHSLRHLAPYVRHHHERWDGMGYPDKLRSAEIPLESRILAICDAVEVMASERPYQRAMSLEEIVVELQRCAGTQFDPIIAAEFVRLLQQEEQELINRIASITADTPLAGESRSPYNGGDVLLEVGQASGST